MRQISNELVEEFIRSLGQSLDPRDVAQEGLVALCHCLGYRRAALFVVDPTHQELQRLECMGIGAEELGCDHVTLDGLIWAGMIEEHLVEASSMSLPDSLVAQFDAALPLADGSSVVGLVLLGGSEKGLYDSSAVVHNAPTLALLLGNALRRALTHDRSVFVLSREDNASALMRQVLEQGAHELSSPLTVLKTAGDLALGESKDREQFLELHTQTVRRVENIATGLLEYAHAEVPDEDRDLLGHRQLVDELILPVIEASPWRHARVHLQHDIHEEALVQIQRDSFLRAAGALLSNAWEFSLAQERELLVSSYVADLQWWETLDHAARIQLFQHWCGKGRPELAVCPPFVEDPPPVDLEAPKTRMVLELIDRGIGIPVAEQGRILEPFFQASNSPSRGLRGAGMGLTVCRRRIEEHEGLLRAHSVPDCGSVFAVFLPLCQGQLRRRD